MIELERVSKYYGNRVGVEDLNLSVPKGQILGLLGPNGAGKTTTMRLITGYLEPTKGKITIAGYDVVEDGLKARRRIGYLPENPPVYPDMSVEGYLTFVARIREVPRSEVTQAVQHVMGRLELTNVRKRLIGRLSKGYKQRVGLAQAIVHTPDVLVLDEPSSGLDPKQITEIRELIRELGKEHTVILSSHILPEVSALCEQVAIINKGKIVAVDRPESLAAHIQGSATLKATVKGPREDVVRTVQQVEGVLAVKVAEEGEGYVSLSLDVAKGSDPREELFYTLAGRDWPLLELTRQEANLEDVFLQLTTEEAGAEEGQRRA